MRNLYLAGAATALSLLAWDANDDLFAASRKGDTAAIKGLLENGGEAKLEAKTQYGQTPLYLAAMNGHADAVQYLISKGASTAVRDTFYKLPMIQFVVQRKHYAVASLLFAAAKTGELDDNISTATMSGQAKLVAAALSAGKPAQAALDRALDAAPAGNTEIAELLKKAGAVAAPAVEVDAKVLASYAGSYKSDQVPIGIAVSVKESKLVAQATGQPEFPLKPKSATRFEFAPARIEIEFSEPGSFTLKQGGTSFVFKRSESAAQ
jgi:hypothetical protein